MGAGKRLEKKRRGRKQPGKFTGEEGIVSSFRGVLETVREESLLLLPATGRPNFQNRAVSETTDLFHLGAMSVVGCPVLPVHYSTLTDHCLRMGSL